MTDRYIWVTGWEDFQSFQKKRGKPWAPPWIKVYPQLLDNPKFLALSPETRMLLVGVFMLFSRTRGTVAKDTRSLSRSLHQRVTKHQLERLNHAGFITFCSGTVLEHKRNAFWNRSNLEVEETQTNHRNGSLSKDEARDVAKPDALKEEDEIPF